MTRKILSLSALLTCLLILTHIGGASTANAGVAGKSMLNPALQSSVAANSDIIEVTRRRHRHSRGPRFRFYFGPSYYSPYYYRPYYYRPYYYRPYSYRSSRYGSRCSYWRSRCAENWGYRNNDYYGCLRYHRCR